MKKFLKTDEWNIIEDSFQADRMRWSESIFSLGNGRFGQRGYFEEPYSSDSYRGTFVAGITFLDKTRVNWWKNGFPQFYTRIPNAPEWSRISLRHLNDDCQLFRGQALGMYHFTDFAVFLLVVLSVPFLSALLPLIAFSAGFLTLRSNLFQFQAHVVSFPGE